MIKKYRKKPVVINALQLTKDNFQEAYEFIGDSCDPYAATDGTFINIKTLEGTMKCRENDFIIKGVKGELYPCKPDIFKKTYEEV